MNAYIACGIIEGFIESENDPLIKSPAEDYIEAWQYLLDTDLCWQLQGWYGRQAIQLINNEIIKEKNE